MLLGVYLTLGTALFAECLSSSVDEGIVFGVAANPYPDKIVTIFNR